MCIANRAGKKTVIYHNGEASKHVTLIYITAQKVTIHQVTTMLATSKNGLFAGHNHLLTTGADDLTHNYLMSASE